MKNKVNRVYDALRGLDIAVMRIICDTAVEMHRAQQVQDYYAVRTGKEKEKADAEMLDKVQKREEEKQKEVRVNMKRPEKDNLETRPIPPTGPAQ